MEYKEKIGFLLKNLDEVTYKEHIVAAINFSSPEYEINTNAIEDIRKSNAGTQMVIVRLPSKLTADLLHSKVKNWIGGLQGA